MIDASLSAHIENATEDDAAANFIQQVLRPEDRRVVLFRGFCTRNVDNWTDVTLAQLHHLRQRQHST